MNVGPPSGQPDPVIVDKIICERLRARRLIEGISQADLGKSIGISAQQIHKYETGMSRMSAGRLAQFASALRAPIVYFYDGFETNETTSQGLISLLSDPSSIEALQHFWKLPKPLRFATLAYLRVLAMETATIGAIDRQTVGVSGIINEQSLGSTAAVDSIADGASGRPSAGNP